MMLNLKILILVFVSFLLTGLNIAQICDGIPLVNGVCPLLECVGIEKCCKWDWDEQVLKSKCSSGGSCDPGWNTQTCAMPKCKPMTKPEKPEKIKCDNTFYGELPAGVKHVRECCKLKDGKKTEAQCCIIVGSPLCDYRDDFNTPECQDKDWAK